MLKIQSADGHECLIAHLHRENVRTLEVIRDRFNSEIALYDLATREWIPLTDLELQTAKEVDAA